MIQNKKLRSITAFGMSGAVVILALIFLVLPKQEYSEKENRYLEKFPVWKWETVKDGEFMSDISDYLSDHFPFRDFFVGLKTNVEMTLGKQELNDVYIAKDGYLIEEYQKPANTKRIAATMKSFYEKIKENDVETHLMLVPTASFIHADKLPEYAPLTSQMETANRIYEESGISAIDCSERLLQQADTDNLYYKTDHHWTTYGAYQGYLEFCRVKNLTPVALEDMTANRVTEEFYGTIYSKVNDYSRAGDEITIYINPADALTVHYMDTDEITDSLYNMEYLEKKDKYSLFLNNLHTLIEITNENAESEDVLVLIKDSYANSMVPFLTTHYRKIYVFDTRYYKQKPSEFIAEHKEVTDVLLLYNMNTLDTDTGIRGIY